ncbi:MAG: MFS transporter [Melioribacteraceae bacterium]|nr:MFS transporter [Melioribacteraceae bacterium]
MRADKNFSAFVWHAFWLALASAFTDKNTIIPAVILLVGGTRGDIGIIAAITIGVPFVTQIFFASFLTNKRKKKPFLLLGIIIRVVSLFGVAISILLFQKDNVFSIVHIIFFWMLIFSLSGAFAGISYTDIIGRSFSSSIRKKFFVLKPLLASVAILISAVVVKGIFSSYVFPDNYIIVFGGGGLLLFIGALGFIILDEKPQNEKKDKELFFEIIKSIPGILSKDATFRYFIIIANLVGVSFTLIPFYMAFVKERFELTSSIIGNLLLIQITGMIISNFIWKRFLLKHSYKGMLKATILSVGLLPVVIYLFSLSESPGVFSSVFLINGAAVSAYLITLEGMLIEISTERNRALYAGIYGTLSISLAIFPVITGWLIGLIGFELIFIGYSFITLSGIFLHKRIICPADDENYFEKLGFGEY